jgi:plasmid stabilization system protein ParE
MNLRIIRLAQRDIDEAAAYYRSERSELGEEFLGEIEAAVSEIARAPYQFEEFRPGMRRFILGRFPYSILLSHLELRSD